jgi:type IV pilus assembly protein PilB
MTPEGRNPVENSRLGELLVHHDLITQDDLESALAEQKRSGGRLGSHLVEMDAITEPQLIAFLSKQLDIARIDFSRSPIQREALELVSKSICEKYTLIPVAMTDRRRRIRLLVAMSDPLNLEAVREIEFASNVTVSAVLALEEDIRRMIEYCYHASGLRESTGPVPTGDPIDIAELEQEKAEKPPVLLRSEDGRLTSHEGRRNSHPELRALLDVLAEKGMIVPEEFREKLSKIRNEGP